ncbi:MAG: ABC transporter substrate-binding protein [Alphaproteobacteria bacterium]|nr:ABC transporter substrate-binding protein [Rhizobiaceae bacterium]MBU3963343.1 ABC transporter substrate-binding protein [Alphaproteobacteria bacterium]MBU4052443.1 ABC transporter substrate-binding protein [Alphaproteobacteria bacterium]MBU4090209.1 ABC transporter substrate-binding protein [Alphaproteobacteria bacterium]MBU4156468.1 ABC transporter substrate-binding protein [Alphaproteobacteria bacterium]
MTKHLAVALATAVAFAAPAARAQSGEKPIQIGLIAPTSGIYARPGTVMKMGAELAIKDVNDAGGISCLGGAPLELVTIDSGDTVEKATNAAQRMVAEYPELVGGTGAYLSSFTLAVSEVTERANLPLLTLSYSDQITGRGFKNIFQTSATAGVQAQLALPIILDLAEQQSGKRPKTVAIITDNTAASLSSVERMKAGLLADFGLEVVLEQVFTPPLADATSLVQQVRQKRPDLLFFLPTVISDSKLILEKKKEFRLDVPVISFGIAIAEPEVLNTMQADMLEGVMSAVANWGAKGQEDLIKRLKDVYGEPWMTQNAISTYGDIWLFKAALEKSCSRDRAALGDALRNLDAGPAKYYPGGTLSFDDKGRREGASLTVIQWQNGVPVTVFPEDLALAKPVWPGK